jgi:hypothetical protein
VASYRISKAAKADLERIYRHGVREYGEGRADLVGSKDRGLASCWLKHGSKLATIGRPAQDLYSDTMAQQALFQNIHRTDPLEFWSKHGLDYRKVTDFLDLNTDELSKIGGVSKRSVRLDSRIPYDLKVRLEQIANICALVAGYFEGDIEKTALWFRTPNPMLGDISPRDMIRFGRYKRLLKFVTEAREANTTSAA